MRLLLMLLLLL